jgi:hypothetical protein
MQSDLSRVAAAYQFLFECCPPIQFDPPWDFVAPDALCRGPIPDPVQTLADLRAQFSDGVLAHAGILGAAPDGTVWLAPSLCVEAGAIILLRDDLDGTYDVLTTLGCLSGCDPVQAALQDTWTQEALNKRGLLFATSRIREVALLRGLGFPATLSLGLNRLFRNSCGVNSLREAWGEDAALNYEAVTAAILEEDDAIVMEQLAHLDEMEDAADEPVDPIVPGSKLTWAEVADLLAKEEAAKNQRSAAREPASPASAAGDEPSDATPASPPIDARPNLVVLCWQPLTLGRAVSTYLRRFADEVEALERHLDVHLPRLAVWRPEIEDLERLRYQFRFRDAALIEETLATSADELFALEIVATIDPRGNSTQAPLTVVTTRAQLHAVLAENGGKYRSSERLRSATAAYEETVERDLIAPLEKWALSRQDPIQRNAAMALAEVSALIHRINPLLHDEVVRHFAKNGGGPDPVRGSLMQQFLQIQNHFCTVVKTIYRL